MNYKICPSGTKCKEVSGKGSCEKIDPVTTCMRAGMKKRDNRNCC